MLSPQTCSMPGIADVEQAAVDLAPLGQFGCYLNGFALPC